MPGIYAAINLCILWNSALYAKFEKCTAWRFTIECYTCIIDCNDHDSLSKWQFVKKGSCLSVTVKTGHLWCIVVFFMIQVPVEWVLWNNWNPPLIYDSEIASTVNEKYPLFTMDILFHSARLPFKPPSFLSFFLPYLLRFSFSSHYLIFIACWSECVFDLAEPWLDP